MNIIRHRKFVQTFLRTIAGPDDLETTKNKGLERNCENAIDRCRSNHNLPEHLGRIVSSDCDKDSLTSSFQTRRCAAKRDARMHVRYQHSTQCSTHRIELLMQNRRSKAPRPSCHNLCQLRSLALWQEIIGKDDKKLASDPAFGDERDELKATHYQLLTLPESMQL